MIIEIVDYILFQRHLTKFNAFSSNLRQNVLECLKMFLMTTL